MVKHGNEIWGRESVYGVLKISSFMCTMRRGSGKFEIFRESGVDLTSPLKSPSFPKHRRNQSLPTKVLENLNLGCENVESPPRRPTPGSKRSPAVSPNIHSGRDFTE